MLKKLLEKQKGHLEHFYAELDLEACERIFDAMRSCQGVLFFTGVGKSGFVAQKVAATMLSTGTKAFYLSPIDALHGDLGMLSAQDLLVVFSKSGETDELLHLLPHVRVRGAQVIAVTSNSTSRLFKGAQLAIDLPCDGELCPYDLAPTTSTELQLLFGDVMAMALMEAKGFSLDAYAKNHPGGQIGRRISVKVRDLMIGRERAPFCLPSDRLEDVLGDFSRKECGCLVVVDEAGRLRGIFTDGDLRRALQHRGHEVLSETMGALMMPTPRAIDVEALAWDAVKVMESDQKRPIMVLPVLDQESVVGLIKMHDIIQAGI